MDLRAMNTAAEYYKAQAERMRKEYEEQQAQQKEAQQGQDEEPETQEGSEA